MTEQAKKNVMVGHMNTAIYQYMPETEEIEEPKDL